MVDYLSANKDRVVIDGDTHPSEISNLDPAVRQAYENTPNYYHGKPLAIPDLLKEMNLAGVDLSLSWQNPAALLYTNDLDSNYEKLLAANRDICTFSERFPDRIIPAGWTDPKALGVRNAKKLVRQCILEFGFPIVKMNPAQNAYMIDSDDVLELVEDIVSYGATVAFHFGGDSPYTPASGLEKLAKRFPADRILAVHMGGGGSGYPEGEQLYQDTRELGLKYPNLFFTLSAIRDCHIESNLITYALAGKPFSSNIACGSDAPYGRQVWNFGGFQRMFESLQKGEAHPDPRLQKNPGLFTPELIQGFRGRNLSELVIWSWKRILERNAVERTVH